HGGVVQVDLKPVPHDHGAVRESQDVLHAASQAVSPEPLPAGAIKAAGGAHARPGPIAKPSPAQARHPGMSAPCPERAGGPAWAVCGAGLLGLVVPGAVSFWPSGVAVRWSRRDLG